MPIERKRDQDPDRDVGLADAATQKAGAVNGEWGRFELCEVARPSGDGPGILWQRPEPFGASVSPSLAASGPRPGIRGRPKFGLLAVFCG